MRALRGAPGIVLRVSPFGLLCGVPSDRRRIKNHARALERSEPRAFGIPLVPADERANFAFARVECLIAEIAGSEIKLLVIERIVGDVHLAIEALERSI